MSPGLLRVGRKGAAYLGVALVIVVGVAILGSVADFALRLALILIGLVTVGVLIVLYPQALLLLLIAGVPWESQLAYPSASLTIIAVVRVLLPLILLIRILATKKQLIAPEFLLPLGLFLCLVLLSLMFSFDPGAGVVKTLRYFLFAASLFAAMQFLGGRFITVLAVRVLTISATAASIYALVEFLNGHLTRAEGPITDPNGFGFILITVIPFAAFLFVDDRKRRAIWGIALVALLAGTLATLSRGALVGLAGLLIWAVVTRRLSAVSLLGAALAIAALIAIAFTFFSPILSQRLAGRERDTGSSAAARTVFWKAAIDMTVDHPLVGVGPERFDVERETYLRNSPIPLEGKQESGGVSKREPVRTAHSSYLEIAAESGILAASAFCLFLAAIWIALRSFIASPESRTDSQGRRLAAALQGSLLAAVLSGIFISGQLDTPFWLIAALAGALTAKDAAERRSSRVRAPSAVLGDA